MIFRKEYLDNLTALKDKQGIKVITGVRRCGKSTLLELLRRNGRVNIGKLTEKEVDFVAVNMNEIEYYQVFASVLDENTWERELAPLQDIRDNYPKTLLTLDDIGNRANYQGIKRKNIIDWLLE